jgi:hypothetical protein
VIITAAPVARARYPFYVAVSESSPSEKERFDYDHILDAYSSLIRVVDPAVIAEIFPLLG